MFPGQRLLPASNHPDLLADAERRVTSTINLATNLLQRNRLERRDVIFPLFIAGTATSQPRSRALILNLIKSFEGSGIGLNTRRTGRLLSAVYEEQERRVAGGGRREEVEWLEVAKGRELVLVNCGL